MLNMNLLGVLNVASVTEFVQNSTFIVDPDTGDITITDKTTASEIFLTINNFAKDTAKLRRVLADGFLTTCVYRVSETGSKRNINSRCRALELHNSTSFRQLQRFMNIAVALGLSGTDDLERRLGAFGPGAEHQEYGRSVFLADSSYDDAALTTLFFDNAGQVRPQVYYEKAGRDATPPPLPLAIPSMRRVSSP